MPLLTLSLVLPLAWIEELGPLLLVIFWVIRQIMSASGGKEEQLEVAEEEKQRRKPLTPEQKTQKQSVEQFLREIGAIEEQEPPELEPIGKQANQFESNVNEAGVQKVGGQGDWAATQPNNERIYVGPTDSFDAPPRVSQASQSQASRAQTSRANTDRSANQPNQRQSTIQQSETRRKRPPVDSQLAENASHLGEQIGQSDERLEARLHEKFDHRLGKLSHREATPTEMAELKTQSQAARILELLSSPSGVRDAIVLNEILKPPVDLWD